MHKPILTYTKGFFNKMARLLTIPRFWGPLATVGFTLAYHAGSLYFGYSITLVWVTVFVVIGTLVSGLRGGLVAAVWGVGYAFYAIPMVDELNRAVQVAIGIVLMALVVGWQTRNLRKSLAELRTAWERAELNEQAAKAMNALNGNIYRIRNARNLLLKTLEHQPLDETAREEIRQVLHVLNNLELATAGWQALEKLKESIEDSRLKAESAGKQAMDDLRASIRKEQGENDAER
jgi:hypothetical protein